MITWFKNEFAHKEVALAEEKGVSPEEMLNHLLDEAPAGSMGLMVQPYWSPGLKEPVAKGAMIGFGDVHTKAHVYRAVIEGPGIRPAGRIGENGKNRKNQGENDWPYQAGLPRVIPFVRFPPIFLTCRWSGEKHRRRRDSALLL